MGTKNRVGTMMIRIQNPTTRDAYLLEVVDLFDGAAFVGVTRNSCTEIFGREFSTQIGRDALLMTAYSAADADISRINNEVPA